MATTSKQDKGKEVQDSPMSFMEAVSKGGEKGGSSSSSVKSTSTKPPPQPQGIHLPYPRVPDSDETPYYVFTITSSKTFDTFYCSYNEIKEPVAHSLYLYEESTHIGAGCASEAIYDKMEEGSYKDELEKICPGLSSDGPKHWKHEYDKHGRHTGLGQVNYFRNMIKLFEYCRHSLPVGRHITTLGTYETNKGTEKQAMWNLLDAGSITSYFKSEFRKNVGLSYIVAINAEGKNVAYLYEYKFYFNKNFQIVDVPMAEAMQKLTEITT